METARVQHEADMKTLKDNSVMDTAQTESNDETQELNDTSAGHNRKRDDTIADHIKTSEESAEKTEDLKDTMKRQERKISELLQSWCCMQ
eukprot:1622013-Amphidinium_carterae.1